LLQGLCHYVTRQITSPMATNGWDEESLKKVQEKIAAGRKTAILGTLVQPRVKAKGKVVKPQNDKTNKTEDRYASHLEKLKLAGEILWYRNHAFGLYFEDGTRYTPDFVVMDPRGEVSLIDVKAYYKNKQKVHIDTASMIRMKRTAHEYWMFTMKVVYEKDGSWQEMIF